MDEDHHHEKIPASMWFAAILVSSQSFLYGYVFSCLNTCLVTGDQSNSQACYEGTDSSCPPGTIYNSFNLSVFDASLATGLVIAGGWVGSMIGTKPAEKYGRRLTLLVNSFTFILGSAFAASGNYQLLFAGRFICGLGVGIISVICPVLLSEIATDGTRGAITTLYQVLLTFSILVAALIGFGFVTNVTNGWQYVQGAAAIPSVMFLLLAHYVPESPKWLISQGRSDEAYQTLSVLRGKESSPDKIAYEMDTIRADCYSNVESSSLSVDDSLSEGVVQKSAKMSSKAGQSASWSEVFECRQGVIVGCVLMVLQPMSGINSVIFYSTTIFSFAGFSPPILGTILLGIVNFILTIVSAYLVDKMGRKILLLGGTYIMTASLIALSSVLLAGDSLGSVQGSLAVFFVLLYIFGFAVGLGAVCWVVMSEIMPTRLRVKAMSLFLNINWAINFMIALATLPVINSFGGVDVNVDDDSVLKTAQKTGVAYLYFAFAGFGFLTLIFLHTYVPETKGHKHGTGESSKTPLLSDRS